MTGTDSEIARRRLRVVAMLAGAYVVAGGGLTLLGWVLGVPRFLDWQGSGIVMKGNAAVCALVCGLALLLSVVAPQRRRLVQPLALFTLLVGAATLLEHVTGIDFGIDTAVFHEPPGAAATVSPGRMGVPASLSFILLGAALFLRTQGATTSRWASALGISVLCIALLPLVGYLYGVSQLYAVSRLTGIAWQTATMLAALAVGIIAAIPDHGLAAALRRNDVGGMALRRLIVPVVLFPIALGWLRVMGERAGFYDGPFGTAARTLVEIILLVGLALWTASSISRHAQTARQAESALRQNQARLVAFLEQLPVGCGLSDSQGRWLVKNLVMQRFAADGLVARDDASAIHHWRTHARDGSLLPPEQWPTARALRGETVNPGADFIHTGHDGRDTWTTVSATPFHDEVGTVVGAITVVEDIDARKRGDESLREREALLRTVTAESRVGLVLIDGGRHYLFANATYADIVGLPDSDIVGKRIEDIQADLYRQMGPCLDQAFTGEQVRHELHLPAHPVTGLEHFYEVSYEPRSSGGSVSHVAVVMADVTARKNAETALREADGRKDEFLAMLAHELRNPLAPLRSGLALIRRAQEHGDHQGFLQTQAMMERQLTQMVRLVDDLIDVSRISRGKIDLRKAPVDLATVLENAVESCRPIIDALGHHLELRQPDHPIVLDADVTRLGQVFANLLNNAAKYTDRGGHIRVTVQDQDGEVSVRIRDDGVGIPEAMLPGIFDAFTQVDTSLERSRSGLGIGLTLVKRLVEMHGGTVTAFSPPPVDHAPPFAGARHLEDDGPPHLEDDGKGSEFVVRLPVVAVLPDSANSGRLPSPSALSAPALVPGLSMPPLRVLIADDNTDGADTLAMLLDDMGFETRTAYDGQEALDAAVDFLPDVLLLDIGMPKVNGYEVGRAIRQRESPRVRKDPLEAGMDEESVAPHLPRRAVLIALTGWGQPDDRRRSREAGFDHHLVKPVDVRALKGLLIGMNAHPRPRGAGHIGPPPFSE